MLKMLLIIVNIMIHHSSTMSQFITSSPSVMPTISTRCAFSYIAIWMRKPCDKQPDLLQMAMRTVSLANPIQIHALSIPITKVIFSNDDSIRYTCKYSLQIKWQLVYPVACLLDTCSPKPLNKAPTCKPKNFGTCALCRVQVPSSGGSFPGYSYFPIV